MKPSKKYEDINWCELVEYSENSPSGLIWKVKRGTKIKPGMTVGHIQRINGRNYEYWTFRHGNKMYNVHRVIYKLVGDNYNPDFVVDHIDRNPLNNNITNLRMVPFKVNARNRLKLSRNTSGTTGVSRRLSRNTYRWVAYISIDGVMQTKSFSEKKYGELEAERLAKAWREKALEQATNEHGFTEHHGKD